MTLPRSWRPILPYVPWLIAIVGSLLFLTIAEKPWAEGLDTTREVKGSIRTHSWAVIGLWYGAAINLVLGIAVVAVLFFARNFRRELRPSLPEAIEKPLSNKEGLFLRIAVLGVAVLGAFMMFPRLNLSLWGDEQATTSRYIIGNVYRVGDNQDEFILKAPRWEKTLFNWDSGPSNQVMFSVLARLVHGPADISADDPAAYYFDEWKIRIPSYLAGIGAILAVCWLVWLLGAPFGAPFAGILMAMHPLIIRYSSEARGYALLIFFGPLVVCFLIKALQTTKLRWWIPFGITQFFLLWSYFGSIYLLVPLNAVALWLAWSLKANGWNPFRSGQVWRWAGATLLGAMLTLQMMLPNLLQLPAFLEGGRLQGSIDWAWVQDSISFWVSGMPWHVWELENPNSETLPEGGPVAMLLIFGLSVFIVLTAGLVHLFRRSGLRFIALILISPALLMTVHSVLSGNLLYPWYTVGFIPLGISVLAIGMHFLDRCKHEQKIRKCLLGVPSVVVVVFFVVVFGPHRQHIRHNSVEPLAESTRHYREVVNPFHPEIDSAKSIAFHFYSRLYDPAADIAESDEEFIALLEKADAANDPAPIWVNTALIPLGKEFFPKAFALLEDPDVFEKPVVFWGMQQPCTRSVFQYIPGSLAKKSAEISAPEGF